MNRLKSEYSLQDSSFMSHTHPIPLSSHLHQQGHYNPPLLPYPNPHPQIDPQYYYVQPSAPLANHMYGPPGYYHQHAPTPNYNFLPQPQQQGHQQQNNSHIKRQPNSLVSKTVDPLAQKELNEQQMHSFPSTDSEEDVKALNKSGIVSSSNSRQDQDGSDPISKIKLTTKKLTRAKNSNSKSKKVSEQETFNPHDGLLEPKDESDRQFISQVVESVGGDKKILTEHALLLCLKHIKKEYLIQYFNELSKMISPKKYQFSEEEDNLILEGLKKYGTSWKKISKMMDGRDPNAIKSRHYYLQKKGVIEKNGYKWKHGKGVYNVNGNMSEDEKVFVEDKDLEESASHRKKVKINSDSSEEN